MARRSSGYSDWERWQRQQAREAERQQREAAVAAKAADRARREHHIATCKREAEQSTPRTPALASVNTRA